jgi:hypothetical protein
VTGEREEVKERRKKTEVDHDFGWPKCLLRGDWFPLYLLYIL